MILTLALSAAAAPDASLHGDLKTFVLGSDPKPWITAPEIPPELEPLLPPGFDPDSLLAAAGFGSDPSVQGIVDLRLKGKISSGIWRAELHHALSALPAGGAGLGGTSAGVGLTAPQLLPLTWEPDVGDQVTLRFRVDRLWVAASPQGLEVTLGRQPITFGAGLVFTPMDVVNPFFVATIDTEYKPGVDALRIDAFSGVATRLTTVAAWAGPLPPTDPDAEAVRLADLVFAEHGTTTVGVTDLQALIGLVRGDGVFGLGTVSSVGPVGVHAEATLTLPASDSTDGAVPGTLTGPERRAVAGAIEEDPFVRAVAGAMYRPTSTTTLTGELYWQTLGATDPGEYLYRTYSPRFQRGELWLLGRYYAALSVAQEITPLVSGNAAVIANLADPSVLLVPGVSWSVANEATVSAGGYLALGAPTDEVPLGLDLATFSVTPPTTTQLARSVHSEFGLYPYALFVAMRTYF